MARGEVPVLHVATDNSDAIRLYEAMGFTHRGVARFMAVRAPDDVAATAREDDPPVRR